jgi:hypothetical protein
MTDLDTDEGEWDHRGNYLTQKFIHNFEEKIGESCQGRLELTDSLIVHVDVPEHRPLNDFDVLFRFDFFNFILGSDGFIWTRKFSS